MRAQPQQSKHRRSCQLGLRGAEEISDKMKPTKTIQFIEEFKIAKDELAALAKQITSVANDSMNHRNTNFINDNVVESFITHNIGTEDSEDMMEDDFIEIMFCLIFTLLFSTGAVVMDTQGWSSEINPLEK